MFILYLREERSWPLVHHSQHPQKNLFSNIWDFRTDHRKRETTNSCMLMNTKHKGVITITMWLLGKNAEQNKHFPMLMCIHHGLVKFWNRYGTQILSHGFYIPQTILNKLSTDILVRAFHNPHRKFHLCLQC